MQTKKNILFIIIYFISNLCIASNNLDTIKLNQNLAATLQFNEVIDFIIFGNNPTIAVGENGQPIGKYYELILEHNIAIIKIRDIKAPFTTLTIMLKNKELYHGYIMMSNNNHKTFYDFKKNNLKEKLIIADSITTANEIFSSNFKKMENIRHEISDVGEIKGNMIFQLTNLINDNTHMYFKVLINNNSSNLYEVLGVSFKILEGKKRSIKKKEIANQNWLIPTTIQYPENKEVIAYSKEYIYFAVPLYSITKGNLSIKIIEKSGNRTADIIIDTETLNSCKVFK